MKKPPFDPEFDSPASRRQRALSPLERELWDSIARQIKPLRKPQRKAAKPQPAPPALSPPEPKLRQTPPAGLERKESLQAAPPPRETPRSAPPLMPIGRRERAHLSRGRKSIDGRIDLHGMTQSQAHRTLLHFLQHASAHGMSFVLVITGKGRGADSERGVLRRQVPHWLGLPEFRAFVVGFEEAHIGHGGEGALYVRVRRGRF